jgi:hypothetical protein
MMYFLPANHKPTKHALLETNLIIIFKFWRCFRKCVKIENTSKDPFGLQLDQNKMGPNSIIFQHFGLNWIKLEQFWSS